jgi:hypothetical protein
VYDDAPPIAPHDTVMLLYAVAVALLIVGAPGGVVCAPAVVEPPFVAPFELPLIEYTVNVPYVELPARPE